MSAAKYLFLASSILAMSCVHGENDGPVSFEARLLCGKLSAFQNEALERAVYNKDLVQELYAQHRKETGCDAGHFAEASSDIVARSLGHDAEGVVGAVEADAGLLSFVLRFVSEGASESDLQLAEQSLEHVCKGERRSSCSSLLEAVQKTLKDI